MFARTYFLDVLDLSSNNSCLTAITTTFDKRMNFTRGKENTADDWDTLRKP